MKTDKGYAELLQPLQPGALAALVALAAMLAAMLFIAGCTSAESPALPSETGPRPLVVFCQTGNCSQATLDFMDSTKDYLYCAYYDLDLPEIKEKLVEKSRVMDVRLYMDDGNYFDTNFSRHDAIGPLMHNKFCVADGSRIITGSFNPTYNGAYRNDNNLIEIDSALLAENYLADFNELWNNTAKRSGVRHPEISYNGFLVENYFCPEDSCAARIEDALYAARKSVYVLSFSFTNAGIANALAAKLNEGVEVMGVFETRNIDNSSQYGFLKFQGANVKMDRNSYSMHHKVFIIDNETVVMGSMNPTASGDDRNDENILIIHSPEIARQYAREFFRVWDLK
jgi:phosphatidylserine/phosphatidylglycerophosphate/cardiolipin synthase-like enzyme